MRIVSSYLCSVLLIGSLIVPARGQDVSSPELGEAARKQDADKAFADAERALTIRLLDRQITQADADTALLYDVTVAAKALSDRISSLRTSVDGKRLAASLDRISASEVQRLFDQPPVAAEDLAAKEKEISSVAADLKKLRDDPPAGFVPPDQQQDELAQLSISVRHMLAHIRERDSWLTALMSATPKNLDVSKAPTLEATIADFSAREQKDWDEAQRIGIDEAKPEALSQITESSRTAELERSLQESRSMLEDAKAEIERAKIDQEMQLRILNEEKEKELAALNQKLAESEAHTAVVNAHAEATREGGRVDAERIMLQQKCQSPEVKAQLAPYLAVGLWQPGDAIGKPWLHDRGPISLSALAATGALRPTTRGLTLFYIYGNGRYINTPGYNHPDAERPKWGYPWAPSQLSQADWQQIRHAQDLLNELGPTMVELGMLNK